MHSFIDVYRFISDLVTEPEAQDSKMFEIAESFFADVFIDGYENIQINMYADGEYKEELDGGGCCILNGFDDDDDEDGEYWNEELELDTRSASYILNHGTPEDVCQLVTDKALFVWQLIHSA